MCAKNELDCKREEIGSKRNDRNQSEDNEQEEREGERGKKREEGRGRTTTGAQAMENIKRDKVTRT